MYWRAKQERRNGGDGNGETKRSKFPLQVCYQFALELFLRGGLQLHVPRTKPVLVVIPAFVLDGASLFFFS